MKSSKSKNYSGSNDGKAKKITEFFPTKYSGSGPPDASLGHWYNFSDFLEHHNITLDKEVLELFKKTLTGSARAWFEQLPKNLTKEELRDEFYNKFYMDIASRTVASEKFWNFERKDKETWGEAVSRLKLLKNRLQYTDQTVIDKLCCLLPLQIRLRMKEIQPTTIDEVLEIIRFYEQEGLSTDPATAKAGTSKKVNVMLEPTSNVLDQAMYMPQQRALAMGYGDYNQQVTPVNPEVQCYHCLAWGHYARDCSQHQYHEYPNPEYQNYREQRPHYAPQNIPQINPRQNQRQYNRGGNRYNRGQNDSNGPSRANVQPPQRAQREQRNTNNSNGNRMTASNNNANSGRQNNGPKVNSRNNDASIY